MSGKEVPFEEMDAIPRRMQPIADFLNSEHTFLSTMILMNDCFVTPITDLANMVVESQSYLYRDIITQVFGNYKSILKANGAMNEELATRVGDGLQDVAIGDVLLKHVAEVMKALSSYGMFYQQSLAKLDHYMKTVPQVGELIKRCEQRPELEKKTLKDLLIKPIQRSVQYKLCLEAIIKRTDVDHPDYEDLHKALRAFSAEASVVNESESKGSSYKQMLTLAMEIDNLPPQTVTSSRRLITVADVKMLDPKPLAGQLYLFNDLLLVALKNSLISNKNWKYAHSVPLTEIFVLENAPSVDLNREPGEALPATNHPYWNKLMCLYYQGDQHFYEFRKGNKAAFLEHLQGLVEHDLFSVPIVPEELQGRDDYEAETGTLDGSPSNRNVTYHAGGSMTPSLTRRSSMTSMKSMTNRGEGATNGGPGAKNGSSNRRNSRMSAFNSLRLRGAKLPKDTIEDAAFNESSESLYSVQSMHVNMRRSGDKDGNGSVKSMKERSSKASLGSLFRRNSARKKSASGGLYGGRSDGETMSLAGDTATFDDEDEDSAYYSSRSGGGLLSKKGKNRKTSRKRHSSGTEQMQIILDQQQQQELHKETAASVSRKSSFITRGQMVERLTNQMKAELHRRPSAGRAAAVSRQRVASYAAPGTTKPLMDAERLRQILRAMEDTDPSLDSVTLDSLSRSGSLGTNASVSRNVSQAKRRICASTNGSATGSPAPKDGTSDVDRNDDQKVIEAEINRVNAELQRVIEDLSVAMSQQMTLKGLGNDSDTASVATTADTESKDQNKENNAIVAVTDHGSNAGMVNLDSLMNKGRGSPGSASTKTMGRGLPRQNVAAINRAKGRRMMTDAMHINVSDLMITTTGGNSHRLTSKYTNPLARIDSNGTEASSIATSPRSVVTNGGGDAASPLGGTASATSRKPSSSFLGVEDHGGRHRHLSMTKNAQSYLNERLVSKEHAEQQGKKHDLDLIMLQRRVIELEQQLGSSNARVWELEDRNAQLQRENRDLRKAHQRSMQELQAGLSTRLNGIVDMLSAYPTNGVAGTLTTAPAIES
eukprot:Clim_evm19s201 gene=Clim_evmTU19s201